MSGFHKTLFFIFDLILLNLSILIGFYFYDESLWATGRVEITYLVIYSNLSWLFLIMVSAPYSINKGWSVSKIIKNQVAFIFIHSLVILSLVVFFDRDYTLLQVLSIYLIFTTLFFISKIVVYYFRKITSNDLAYRNFILIGRNSLSTEIRKYYLMNEELGYRFKGYIDFDSQDLPTQEVQKFCSENEVHEIYCCMPGMESDKLKQLINFGLDSLIKVKVVMASNPQVIQLDRYDKLPVLNVSTIPLDESIHQFVKRVFDIIFSSFFLLLVMSWLVPLLGIIIKLDSKGPVFFKQLRSGKDNKPFNCLKFRTMFVNSDSDTKQATQNDSRITKLGAFLRKTSIDELPQFINVFMGSMSVVGPRPHMLKHTIEYSKLIETFMGRHYVKPGITGLAQCLGYRGETKDLVDMENRVRLDRYYIENWSFWLDIKIIFLTIVSLLRGSEKAY